MNIEEDIKSGFETKHIIYTIIGVCIVILLLTITIMYGLKYNKYEEKTSALTVNQTTTEKYKTISLISDGDSSSYIEFKNKSLDPNVTLLELFQTAFTGGGDSISKMYCVAEFTTSTGINPKMVISYSIGKNSNYNYRQLINFSFLINEDGKYYWWANIPSQPTVHNYIKITAAGKDISNLVIYKFVNI